MRPVELEALVEQVAELLDRASRPFVEGHRAEAAVRKKAHDFATQVDRDLEVWLKSELQAATGIGVHGEEFGGTDLDESLVWVVDPIDGTFNYAAGSPMAAILLALLRKGDPVAGLTWLPFTGQRFTAVSGGPVRQDGAVQPPLVRTALSDSIVGVGTFNAAWGGRFPGRWRLAVFEQLSTVCSKLRMHGATGIDMAFVSSGILGAAISFGHHVWDHAAGVALVRAAGGVVTDLAGEPWTIRSDSALAAAPGVHEEILAVLRRVGPPGEYR